MSTASAKYQRAQLIAQFSGEGDKVIGRVTRIEVMPGTQKAKGEKPAQKRRKMVESEDEDEDGEPSDYYQSGAL